MRLSRNGARLPDDPGDDRHDEEPALTPPEEGAQKDMDAEEFLARARAALLAEGFKDTPMQYRKKDQVFGLVKDHGDRLQLHVRAFRNGLIESEVELSNRYVEHLWSPRRSAHSEIAQVFEKHGLQTSTINTEFQTRTGSQKQNLPRIVTPTRQLFRGAMGVAGAMGAMAFMRYIQRNTKSASRARSRRWRR